MQATYVAQDGLEPLINPKLQLQPGQYNDGSTTYSGIVFNRTYQVVVNGNLTTISYTVTWNDGVGHNITFSTVRSQ
jgi:hypothetical protein